MKKSHLILFIGGTIVAIGMITSFYGSELVKQGTAFSEGVLNGTTIEVTKELDPAIRDTGMFFVVTKVFESEDLVALVFDPNGKQLVKKVIQHEKTTEEFEISTKGSYRVILENSRSDGNYFRLGLSHTLDETVIAINYLGSWIMVSGFVGVGLAIILEIKNRKKKVS